MNKQFDLFQKMKIKEVCENISRMTYAYINPGTKQPTVVPSKHYKDILDQPVEVLVNDQVKKQFLNIMFKQMKTLKQAKIGDTVRVVKLHGEGAVKRRIMDMGITKGAEVHIRKVAPLGDPVEVTVRGYELSIRKADAEMIEVE